MNSSSRNKITLSSVATVLGIISFVFMVLPTVAELQWFGVELVIISSFDSEYNEIEKEYSTHVSSSPEKTDLKNKLDKMKEIKNLIDNEHY